MGSSKRVYYTNAIYHITARGNNRQMILKRDDDKKVFLDVLSKYKCRFKFKLFGFVIMDNHVHLAMKTPEGCSISQIMQAVLLSYSVRYRHKRNYTGYLWEGRFKSYIIENELYLVRSLEYMHNNPVVAGIVTSPQKYSWSSFYFYNDYENKYVSQYGLIDGYTSSVTG